MMRELSQIIGYISPTSASIFTQPEGNESITSFPGNSDYLDKELASGIDHSAIVELQDEILVATVALAPSTLPVSETYYQGGFDQAASMDAIHQAISLGEDPGGLLEAAASGSSPITEGGHSFVQVATLGQSTTPTSGISTSISTNDFASPVRPVPNASQQPLDFSDTIDITSIQENSAPNSVTFTSFTLTDDQDTRPLELNLTPEINDIDGLVIEAPKSSSGSFFYTFTGQTTPISGFETQGPAAAFEPSSEPLVVSYTGHQTTPVQGFDTEGPFIAFEPSPEPLFVIIPDEVL